MSLVPGTRLGPYEIESLLGAGGMGEVYRARDTRLDRTVAVKVLPEVLAADPVFRERFEREARTLSGLSHPNICTVYDVGRHDGVDYLVMEYLEGRTLATVLEAGAMATGDALAVADQVADALIVAHRHGIVHRDLKPANVMIVRGRATPGIGTAKLLDFGLAKRAVAASATMTGVQVADSTRAAPLTGTGTVLGTFQYMAPEQIEGRDADARADVWAFGCLLYEMITARRAFQAQTQASLIAAILERQPAPIHLPDPALGPALNRLISACLEKDPDERFQSMRDARRELAWLVTNTAPQASAGPNPRRGVAAGLAALLGLVLVGATVLAMRTLPGAARLAPPAVFTLSSGPGFTVGPSGFFGGAGSGAPAVSPDGRSVAFIAHNATETTIWLRDLSSLEPRQLRGTGGVRGLFWSPDGGAIGFFASGKLKTIAPASGRVEIVCDAPAAFGGTWAADGTILFSPDERTPIYRVNVQGGTPAPVTALVAGREQAHRWPHFLPDGRHFLYMPWTDGTTNRQVMLASLDGGAARALFDSQSGAVLAGDHLLYILDSPPRLVAWRFDTKTLALRGQPFTLVPDENVDYQWVTGEPNSSAAGTTLTYTTGKYRRTQLRWVSRTGRPLETVGETGVYFDPVISPDGSRVALERTDPGLSTGDIWTIDLARGAFSRLTSAPGYETTAVWSPDGQRIAYASDQARTAQMYVKDASGAGTESLLLTPTARSWPLDWSADGRYILYMLNGGATHNDVWVYDLQGRTAAPLLNSPFNEGWARVSPDGKWVAYASDESQQMEVYVRSFPDGAVKVQISSAGGTEPQWRQDGRELFYIAPDNTVCAVDVRSAAGRFEASKPQGLFTANVDQNKTIRNQYAVSPDGQRFLILSLVDGNVSPIVAVLNWRALLRQ